MAHASITGQDIDLNNAKRLLKDVIKTRPKSIPVERIQNTVADYFNLSSDLLRGSSRKKEIVRARQIAMFLSGEMTELTLKSIGTHFGNRDHSTVIHSLEIAKALQEKDSAARSEIEDLRRRLELNI